MSTSVGLAIKAALERAEMHEALCPRRLKVRIGAMYAAEGHHTDGLQVRATIAARDGDELAYNTVWQEVPWEQLDARAGELVGIVDACVASVENRFGLRRVVA